MWTQDYFIGKFGLQVGWYKIDDQCSVCPVTPSTLASSRQNSAGSQAGSLRKE